MSDHAYVISFLFSHQWMFITDTVDAVYPPKNWSPQAIMDRLGEIVGTRQDLVQSRRNSSTPHTSQFSNGSWGSKLSKPLLGSVSQSRITSISSLEPFFSRASLANYETVYALEAVDWQAVESSVELDLFEGDEPSST